MRGHIRNRGKDTWQIIYWVGGKQKSQTVHGTRREAETVLATVIADLSRGRHVLPGKETLSSFLRRWLKEIEPHVRPNTLRAHKTNVDFHIVPRLGSIRISDLQPLEIQKFYRELLESGRIKKQEGKNGLSSSSVNSVHRTLRRALNQAIEWGFLAQNPCQRVKAPACQAAERPILTAEGAQKLLQKAIPTRRTSLYLAGMTTGLRLGELLGLRWQDIDLDRGIIHVCQQLDGRSPVTKPIFCEVKTKAGRRTVTIPPVLVDALRREWAIEEQLLKRGCPNPHGLVWHAISGHPLSRRNVERQFKLLLSKAGLPDTRFQDLRHTHASWLLQAGVHPKVVQERLGHSQIGVTMDTYSHVTPTLQQQAAEVIDKLFQK